MSDIQKQAFEKIKKLLNSKKTGVLATCSAKGAYTSLICFTANADMTYLLFATARATRKYSNMQGCSNVSILIDNRIGNLKDLHSASGLTVLGKAIELNKNEYEQGLKDFLKIHPLLSEFLLSPDCALLKVQIEKFILVSSFQEVTEFYPKQTPAGQK